jgi:uncharacterized membrane protein
VHSFLALQGGFVSDVSISETSHREERHTLTPLAILLLAEHEPSWLPDVASEEIEDKSKTDGLGKGIVCIQAVWFIIQCVARLASKGYSISLLELNTLAHALCMLLIYWLWWDKPLNIEEPVTIRTVPASVLIGRLNRLNQMPRFPVMRKRLRNFPSESFTFIEGIIDLAFYPAQSNLISTDGPVFVLGFAVAGAIYGGLHMFGWNAPFTSHPQLLLWRISSITITASGLFIPLMGLTHWAIEVITEKGGAGLSFDEGEISWLRMLRSYCWLVFRLAVVALLFVLLMAGALFYLFARAYLVVECFISLAYLPDSAFKQPAWIVCILHIQ